MENRLGVKEGLGGRRGVDTVRKGQHKGSFCSGIVSSLDCISMDILDVILDYSFSRCYHW